MRSHEQERPPIQCSRGVGILRRKLIVLQTLLLGLQTFESLRDQRWRGLTFQVSTQDELPSHLLSWHLFEPRVLVEPLPEGPKDLVEARLVLLGHTPWRVAAGHLAPLEGFMPSAILTARFRLRSARRGSALPAAETFGTYLSWTTPPGEGAYLVGNLGCGEAPARSQVACSVATPLSSPCAPRPHQNVRKWGFTSCRSRSPLRALGYTRCPHNADPRCRRPPKGSACTIPPCLPQSHGASGAAPTPSCCSSPVGQPNSRRSRLWTGCSSRGGCPAPPSSGSSRR